MEEELTLGKRDIQTLILRTLVRKLVEKGLLTRDDVRSLLIEATRGLDIVGGKVTARAAENIVESDLVRPFLGGM